MEFSVPSYHTTDRVKVEAYSVDSYVIKVECDRYSNAPDDIIAIERINVPRLVLTSQLRIGETLYTTTNKSEAIELAKKIKQKLIDAKKSRIEKHNAEKEHKKKNPAEYV